MHGQHRVGAELAQVGIITPRPNPQTWSGLDSLPVLWPFNFHLKPVEPVDGVRRNGVSLKVVVESHRHVLSEYVPESFDPFRCKESCSATDHQTRDQAYQALDSIAAYLHRTEPHSPTPYLIKRAVNWGRMPLPELMAEVIREEGDLNKLINLLGLSDPNDRP